MLEVASVTCSDLFGAWGSAWLGGLRLPQPYAGKVTSLRQLIGELNTEITMLSEVLADLLAGHRGYLVIQRLPGIGPVLAAAPARPIIGSRPPASRTPSGRRQRRPGRGPGP